MVSLPKGLTLPRPSGIQSAIGMPSVDICRGWLLSSRTSGACPDYVSVIPSIIRPSPSLRRVSWSRFPTPYRYYEKAKTAFALLVAFGSPRLRYHLTLRLLLFASQGGRRPLIAWMYLGPSVRPCLYVWRREALSSSRGNLPDIDPPPRPRPERSGLTMSDPPLLLPM